MPAQGMCDACTRQIVLHQGCNPKNTIISAFVYFICIFKLRILLQLQLPKLVMATPNEQVDQQIDEIVTASCIFVEIVTACARCVYVRCGLWIKHRECRFFHFGIEHKSPAAASIFGSVSNSFQ